jgi:hypothetical protein
MDGGGTTSWWDYTPMKIAVISTICLAFLLVALAIVFTVYYRSSRATQKLEMSQALEAQRMRDRMYENALSSDFLQYLQECQKRQKEKHERMLTKEQTTGTLSTLRDDASTASSWFSEPRRMSFTGNESIQTTIETCSINRFDSPDARIYTAKRFISAGGELPGEKSWSPKVIYGQALTKDSPVRMGKLAEQIRNSVRNSKMRFSRVSWLSGKDSRQGQYGINDAFMDADEDATAILPPDPAYLNKGRKQKYQSMEDNHDGHESPYDLELEIFSSFR